MDFTHFNEQGRARMVDVTEKPATDRTALAAGRVYMRAGTLAAIKEGRVKKGDVLAVAQVAGIMAAKRTWENIPMCHPVPLTGVDIAFEYEENAVAIRATARCKAETGVEMEALSAVSAAALTIYDMCKAVDKRMALSDIHLLEKHGGKSGDFRFEDNA